MRAAVFEQYGDPDVVRTIDLREPAVTPGSVRVHVVSAGIQPFDAMMRSGRTAQWMPAHFPQQVGNEFAGVIEEVGEGVDGFAVGEAVLGWCTMSAHAETLVTPADQVVRKPPSMPWEEAGCLSASGQTASTALEVLGIGDGDTLLLHAASGGVGSLAVQLAVALGATVIGTASPRNHEFLRELGAIPVAYGDGLLQRLHELRPDGFDAALDAVGTPEALTTSVEVVKDKDRIGTLAWNPVAQDLGIQQIGTQRSAARLQRLVDAWERGELRVPIQEVIPLEESHRAHELIQGGHVRGKIAVLVG